jgi:hypothetical protein
VAVERANVHEILHEYGLLQPQRLTQPCLLGVNGPKDFEVGREGVEHPESDRGGTNAA